MEPSSGLVVPSSSSASSPSSGPLPSVGTAWEAVNAGIPLNWVQAITVSPHDANLWLAAPYQHGIFRSTDAGLTWRTTRSQRPIGIAEKLIFHPSRPNVVFAAGVDVNIQRSLDAGLTWNEAGGELLVGAWTMDLAFHPSAPGVMYSAGYQQGILRSVDDGATFQLWSEGLPELAAVNPFANATSVAALAGNPVTVLAVVDERLWVRTEDAAAWSPVDTPGVTPEGVVADPHHPGRALVHGFGALLPVTVTAGSIQVLPSSTGPGFIQFDCCTPRTIYGHDYADVFSSTDEGASWTALPVGGRPSLVQAIAAHPTSTGTVLAGLQGGGAAVFDPAVMTWNPHNTGLPYEPVPALVLDELEPMTLLAARFTDGLRSHDLGLTWTSSDNSAQVLTTHAARPGTIWAAKYDDLWRSLDSGRTWNAVYAPAAPELSGLVSALVAAPSNADILYACAAAYPDLSLVFRSQDGGSGWTLVSGDLPHGGAAGLAVDSADPNRVYVSVGDSVFESTVGGDTWLRRTTPRPGMAVTLLAGDPLGAGALFAVVDTSGLYASTNGASTWSRVLIGDVTAVNVEAAGPNRVIVALNQAGLPVLRASESGRSPWVQLGSGLPSGSVRAIARRPGGDRVYVGTSATGVWRGVIGIAP